MDFTAQDALDLEILLSEIEHLRLRDLSDDSGSEQGSLSESIPDDHRSGSSGVREGLTGTPPRRWGFAVAPVASLGYCTYCMSNRKAPKIYGSHKIRNHDGVVTCPLLRARSCTLCHSRGGDQAHTRNHCPNSPFYKTPTLHHVLKTYTSS